MKKKFKFHCLDDDSESVSEESDTETSDDVIPETNVPAQILNTNNLIQNKFLSDDDNITPPPPLPSPSSSSSQSPLRENDIKNLDDTDVDEADIDENKQLQDINLNEESPPPASIPDDLFFNDADEPPPPEVEEAEDVEEHMNDDIESKNHDKTVKRKIKNKKASIPKSLKAKNKTMTREKGLILNTNRIYDYFDHKISKLSILKAIHAKCGDFRLAILALAQNPTQFDNTSLFESPKSEPETIKEYLKL